LLGLLFNPEDGSDMFFKISVHSHQNAWHCIPVCRTTILLHAPGLLKFISNLTEIVFLVCS
jgi:hypothetical protein